MPDLLQWPAMLITVLASWLVASKPRRRRHLGFCTFLVSNALWIAWAIPAGAYALVTLQGVLVVTNVRGIIKCRAE